MPIKQITEAVVPRWLLLIHVIILGVVAGLGCFSAWSSISKGSATGALIGLAIALALARPMMSGIRNVRSGVHVRLTNDSLEVAHDGTVSAVSIKSVQSVERTRRTGRNYSRISHRLRLVDGSTILLPHIRGLQDVVTEIERRKQVHDDAPE